MTGSSQQRFMKAEITSDQPDSFLQWDACWDEREVDVIYLDFSRAFDAVSYNILIDILMKYRLNK